MPSSTDRIPFASTFTFHDTAALVRCLGSLGIGAFSATIMTGWRLARHHNALSGESTAYGGHADDPVQVADALRHAPALLIVSESEEDSGS